MGMSRVTGSSRSISATRQPSSPGIITSRRMRSGRSARARSRPPGPSPASLTVFANSEYERRAVSNKLLAGRAAVVPNGWELPAAAPSPEWRGEARRLIAYVGAMGEQDCLVHLVEAIALLEEKDVRVVLAGDGSARPAATS